MKDSFTATHKTAKVITIKPACESAKEEPMLIDGSVPTPEGMMPTEMVYCNVHEFIHHAGRVEGSECCEDDWHNVYYDPEHPYKEVVNI